VRRRTCLSAARRALQSSTLHKDFVPAFVVRYRGKVQGYLNRCAHVRVELDAQPGEFFDVAGLYLVCGTHGAAYVPETGYCVGGPCKGLRLTKLASTNTTANIYLLDNKETVHV